MIEHLRKEHEETIESTVIKNGFSRVKNHTKLSADHTDAAAMTLRHLNVKDIF